MFWQAKIAHQNFLHFGEEVIETSISLFIFKTVAYCTRSVAEYGTNSGGKGGEGG
jgi:hypothetical protein